MFGVYLLEYLVFGAPVEQLWKLLNSGAERQLK